MAATKWQRRAAVASASNGQAATTERGPPYHSKTCAQNARMFRQKGLIPADVLIPSCSEDFPLLPVQTITALL